MTTLSFYARGDSSSANNAALNIENTSQQPTVLITFDSGPDGDIVLEHNGGNPDPDTTVTIDGQTYDFTVELTGDLPFGSGKVPDALEGLQVTVISVDINGTTERFFFVTDGSGTQSLMDNFGNGAVALSNADFAPPPVLICFCAGTRILTPYGYKKIESLRIGDRVTTDQGDAKNIKWIAQSDVRPAQLRNSKDHRPIRIFADALAPGVPFSDLDVSPQHRVVLGGYEAELLFGTPEVLVPAKFLIGTIAARVDTFDAVSYFHLLLDKHDMVVSNGMPAESFQLSTRNLRGISPQARMSLCNTLDNNDLQAMVSRKDAMRSLTAHEALVLQTAMFGTRPTQIALHNQTLPFGSIPRIARPALYR